MSGGAHPEPLGLLVSTRRNQWGCYTKVVFGVKREADDQTVLFRVWNRYYWKWISKSSTYRLHLFKPSELFEGDSQVTVGVYRARELRFSTPPEWFRVADLTDYQPENTEAADGPKPIGIMIRHIRIGYQLVCSGTLFFNTKSSGHRVLYRLWNPSREYYWSSQHGKSRLHFFDARKVARQNTTTGVYRGTELHMHDMPQGLTLADIPGYQPDTREPATPMPQAGGPGTPSDEPDTPSDDPDAPSEEQIDEFVDSLLAPV